MTVQRAIRRQRTLAAEGAQDGVGLHTGAVVRARLLPAPPDTGLRLVREDVAHPQPIAVHVSAVRGTFLSTVLGDEAWTVSTVEHLLAALVAEGVDNALISVSGPEVPVLDGSAAGWCALIRSLGLQDQEAPRRRLVVTAPVEVQDGARLARLLPADRLELAARIDFPHPTIGRQSLDLTIENGNFAHEIAWARTFGFASEVEAMRAAGLARGGSLDNALVFDETGIVNAEGSRSPDEPARHKVLDMMGDLALVGMPVQARFEADLPGHGLSVLLVRALLARTECWRIVEG